MTKFEKVQNLFFKFSKIFAGGYQKGFSLNFYTGIFSISHITAIVKWCEYSFIFIGVYHHFGHFLTVSMDSDATWIVMEFIAERNTLLIQLSSLEKSKRIKQLAIFYFKCKRNGCAVNVIIVNPPDGNAHVC